MINYNKQTMVTTPQSIKVIKKNTYSKSHDKIARHNRETLVVKKNGLEWYKVEDGINRGHDPRSFRIFSDRFGIPMPTVP